MAALHLWQAVPARKRREVFAHEEEEVEWQMVAQGRRAPGANGAVTSTEDGKAQPCQILHLRLLLPLELRWRVAAT